MSIPRWFGNLNVRIGFLVALWALLEAGASACSAQGPPATAPRPETAVEAPKPSSPNPAPARAARPWPTDVIILNNAADVVEFWKKLTDHDFMIMKPGPKQALEATNAASPPLNASREYVVNSVKVRGIVEGDNAKIELLINCSLLVPGPIWVPIRLDDPGVLAARENAKELELRQGPQNQWEARLQGLGEHQLQVELLRPIRIDTERRRLELAIPEAPATSFDLALPKTVFDVDLGSGETVGQAPLAGGKGVRLFGHIAPRSRLVLGWSEQGESGSRVAPLLTAQVEMAVDVDMEAVTTRSSWAISCERGVARSLQIRLEDEEVVTRLQLNDQFPASGIEQAAGGNLLTIHLGEPLRLGEARRLVLETRRPSSAAEGKPLAFSGYPLTNASDQSGAIGITHSANLFLNILKSQGLRRIDPRDLPTALKARPGTTIALQFLEQEFRLELGVEGSPPLFRTEASTQLFFEADAVRNDTTIEVQRVRGSLFEIEIDVPTELKIVSVGPPDLVEATTTPPQESSTGPDATQANRILKIRLTAQGRDQKSVSLKLGGRQSVPSSGDVQLGLFTPRGAVTTTASLALYAGRDLTLESLDETMVKAGPGVPLSPGLKPTDDASKAAGEADSTSPPSLRLQSNRNPGFLKIRLERHALAITHESRLAARASRRTVVVRQETALKVRHGVLQSLIARVPERAAALWEVSGKDAIRREDLGVTETGVRRYRLIFDQPVLDGSTLVFRYRLPLSPGFDSAGAASFQVPWIAIEEGTSTGCTIDLSSDPEMQLAVDDAAWTLVDEEDGGRPEASSDRSYRLNPDAAAVSGLSVSAQLVESVSLPRLVVSRALIRSTLGFEDDLRIRAWYALDTHPASLTLSLPEGARWIRARVDGRTIEQIEADVDGLSYRLDLPPESNLKPVVVDVEYLVSAKDSRKSWRAPDLLEGADVLQSYWLVQIPWKSALIGVPDGWADENRWYWDYYVWKRRPLAPIGKLVGWVADPTVQADILDDTLDGDTDVFHGYLFGRAGAPKHLNPWVVSRAWIIVACSGLVLLAGFGLFLFPINERWVWGVTTVSALLAVMFLHPSVIALFLQSATCGFLLVLFGYLIHRTLRRHDGGGALARASGPSTSGGSFDSSQRSALGVGSDDSTAIRMRVPSTMDYLSLPATAKSDLEAARSSTAARPPSTD